jgi:hypothetical protein
MNGEQTLGLQYEKRPPERNVSDGLLFSVQKLNRFNHAHSKK